MAFSFDKLVKTEHVLCPNCKVPTFGPYHDIDQNVYFDGHYCEDCALTWHWNAKKECFDGGHFI